MVLPCVAMAAWQANGYARPPGEVQVGIYVRISQDRTGAGLGVQRQEEDCRALAERRGWHVFNVYVDNDVSAFSRRRRPGWSEMLDDVQTGRIHAIIGWHVDRLTRRPSELEHLIDLADTHRLQLGTVTGDIDLGNPMGRLLARQLGSIARYESEHRGERRARQLLQAAEAGQLMRAGKRCYGYQRDGTIEPAEAAIIREAVERVLRGESMRSIVSDFHEREIKTTQGGYWIATSLKRLLINQRLSGKRVYKGQVVAEGDWEPILDPSEQRKVVAVLTNPKRRTMTTPNSTGARKYLLTGGIIVCGLCGKKMESQPSSNGKPGYVCRQGPPTYGCGKTRIAAAGVEQDVAERVLGRLASPAIRARLQAAVQTAGDSGEMLTDQIGDLEQRLVELGEDYADGRVNRVAFQSASNRIDAKLAELRAAVVRVAKIESLPDASTPEDLADWWENGSTLERRRDLVMTLLEHVEIMPATRRGFSGYDEDRVRFIWK